VENSSSEKRCRTDEEREAEDDFLPVRKKKCSNSSLETTFEELLEEMGILVEKEPAMLREVRNVEKSYEEIDAEWCRLKNTAQDGFELSEDEAEELRSFVMHGVGDAVKMKRMLEAYRSHQTLSKQLHYVCTLREQLRVKLTDASENHKLVSTRIADIRHLLFTQHNARYVKMLMDACANKISC
jgi:hypothetical protein